MILISGDKAVKTLHIMRFIKYLLGLFVLTIGVGFAIKSNLGAAPVSAFPYTLQVVTGLEIGLGTILFQSVLVIIQMVLLRKKFKIKNLLQIPVGVIFGWLTTASTALVGLIPYYDNIIFRIVMVLIGSFFIALGIALYVPTDIVPLPSEGIIKTVSDLSSVPFSNIKIAFDCTMVILSGLVCYFATGTLKSVGIGTVVLAVLVGLINKLIMKVLQKIKGITQRKERE